MPLAALALLPVVSGCGQTGALYLPEDESATGVTRPAAVVVPPATDPAATAPALPQAPSVPAAAPAAPPAPAQPAAIPAAPASRDVDGDSSKPAPDSLNPR